MQFKNKSQAKKVTGLSYLGSINQSAKLAKNGTVSGVLTYGLYLAPASESGYNVCPFSTPECRAGCLATSGRAAMDIRSGANKIKNSRIKKTRLFFEHRNFFFEWLIAEITAAKKKAERQNMGFSVRLNCTSDIDWQREYYKESNIFDIFPDVQFYDYTKNPGKFIDKPDNYHLTFSYTGKNTSMCERLLNRGFNIAVVFKNSLPGSFLGCQVVDGDKTDYRARDGQGVVIGLRFKSIADKTAEKQVLNSCFVVDAEKPGNIEQTFKIFSNV